MPALFCLCLFLAPPDAYPRPDLLIEPAALSAVHGATILDVRGKHSYNEGHIPGAVWVDAITWERQFTSHPEPDAWRRRLGDLGIGGNGPVVVYGGDDVRPACRTWWILRYWGLPDVRILNGGWSAWKSAGGPVSTDVPRPAAHSFKLSPRPERLATRAELLEDLRTHPPQIVDARSQAEHCGLAHTAKRNGAIPGSIHLEWTECIDRRTHRFKSPEELRRLIEERKIDVNRPAVTYCQSGGRAAVVAFALELMGGRQVKNYYQSWAEWGNAPDTPIQKIPPPAK